MRSIMKKFILLGLLFTSGLFSLPLEEKPMVVVIPSYKNRKWCSSNVSSVLSQRYSNFRVIYVDDASPDGTADKVESVVLRFAKRKQFSFNRVAFDDQTSKALIEVTKQFDKEVNADKAFFTLVANKNRAGALANLYRSIWSCEDEEIVITLDGDDWFSDPDVLSRLNQTYSSKEVWLTHGTMIEYPSGSKSWCEPVPTEVISSNKFRSFKCPSHLRTFYSWLFKQIRLEDLVYEGDFFTMTWDMAMMYPMVEMCAERHEFVSTPNYVYNMVNPINDNKVNAELQRHLDKLIRGMPPYKRLEEPVLTSKASF